MSPTAPGHSGTAPGHNKPTTTKCPICGRPLVEAPTAAKTPTTAPWVCNDDRMGFWNAELSPAARHAFRAHLRDWGHHAGWLREAVRRERGKA